MTHTSRLGDITNREARQRPQQTSFRAQFSSLLGWLPIILDRMEKLIACIFAGAWVGVKSESSLLRFPCGQQAFSQSFSSASALQVGGIRQRARKGVVIGVRLEALIPNMIHVASISGGFAAQWKLPCTLEIVLEGQRQKAWRCSGPSYRRCVNCISMSRVALYQLVGPISM